MKLLKITDNEHEELDSSFDQTKHVKPEQVYPQISEKISQVMLNGESAQSFDSAFIEIPRRNATFGRILLEILEEARITTNYSSTGFYIMSKKNYLYHVLHEKNIKCPKTVITASEKASRNLENELEFPVVAKRYQDFQRVEMKKLQKPEEVQDFTEGIEYDNNILIFQHLKQGEKYRCMVTPNDIISLKDDTEDWRITTDNLNYSNISQDLQERAMRARKVIGTPIAEVLIQAGRVVDVNPNPDLELFTKVSGKNAYETVAEVLKGDLE